MLGKFGDGLKNTFRKIAGLSLLDEKTVDSIIRDLQRTLLQSDVDVELVAELSDKIKERAMRAELPPAMTMKEYFVKMLYDGVVDLLGAETSEIGLKKQRILVIGLFGSGKTTTAGKLAKWFKTRGLKPCLVACDTHRAAAQEQLKQIGKQIEIPVYHEGKSPEDIAGSAIKKSKEDVLIFDSAGRNAIDRELAAELERLNKEIKPDEVLLVLPADIGHIVRQQTEEFNKLVGITGIIVTKTDGTAKAGGALAAARASGAKIKFIGTGEKTGDFELYNPQRFVSRLIGYGDIQSLLEKAKETGFDEEKAKQLLEEDFTIDTFIEQIKQMEKMGPISNVVEMIPGISGMKMPKDLLDVQAGKMKKWKHIISSFTLKEKKDPDIIDASRIKRIASGSGVSEADVRELLKNYKQIKKVMKMAKGGKGFKRGGLAAIARQFGLG